MYVERYYRMLKYWCKILKTENIVLKLVMNPCLNKVIQSLIRSLTGLVILEIVCVDMVSMIYGSLKMLLMKINVYVNLSKELLIVL